MLRPTVRIDDDESDQLPHQPPDARWQSLTMHSNLVIACVLVGVTVIVHASGLAVLLRVFMRSPTPMPKRFWPIVWLLIRLTLALILIHLSEIAVWAFFYLWTECLPNAESAFYFSGVTYTTIGYGDLVLPRPWRLLGPVEGLTGILMCGLSTGLFVALLGRVIGGKVGDEPD